MTFFFPNKFLYGAEVRKQTTTTKQNCLFPLITVLIPDSFIMVYSVKKKFTVICGGLYSE